MSFLSLQNHNFEKFPFNVYHGVSSRRGASRTGAKKDQRIRARICPYLSITGYFRARRIGKEGLERRNCDKIPRRIARILFAFFRGRNRGPIHRRLCLDLREISRRVRPQTIGAFYLAEYFRIERITARFARFFANHGVRRMERWYRSGEGIAAVASYMPRPRRFISGTWAHRCLRSC